MRLVWGTFGILLAGAPGDTALSDARLLLVCPVLASSTPLGARGEQAEGVMAGLSQAAGVGTLLCPVPGEVPCCRVSAYPPVPRSRRRAQPGVKGLASLVWASSWIT